MRKLFFTTIAAVFLVCAALPLFAELSAIGYQNILDTARDDNKVRGTSVAVSTPQYGTWLGSSNKNVDDPVNSSMLFNVASITKTYTSACILQLIEKGDLFFDDTVGELLPEVIDELGSSRRWYNWKIRTFKKVDENATVLELLTHTSGIDDFSGESELVTSPNDIVLEPIDILETITAKYEFEKDYDYCNTNYIILGMILEKYGNDVIEEAIFSNGVPVGVRGIFSDMIYNNSNFGLDLSNTFLREKLIDVPVNYSLAKGYEYSLIEGLEFLGGIYTSAETFIGTGETLYSMSWTTGSIFATAEDVATWIKALCTNNIIDGDNIIEKSIEMGLVSKSNTKLNGYSKKYGLGLMQIDISDLFSNAEKIQLEQKYGQIDYKIWGHTGTNNGFRASAFYWADLDISISVLNNDNAAFVSNRPFSILEELLRYTVENI